MESFYTISPIKRLFFQKNKLRFKKKRLLFTIFYTICRSNFIQYPRYTKSPIKNIGKQCHEIPYQNGAPQKCKKTQSWGGTQEPFTDFTDVLENLKKEGNFDRGNRVPLFGS